MCNIINRFCLDYGVIRQEIKTTNQAPPVGLNAEAAGRGVNDVFSHRCI